MNNDFEDKPILKMINIKTQLDDLGNQAVVLTGEGLKQKIVPVSSLQEYDYVKNYIYKLNADNKALNLVVDKLSVKEEKQEVNKDKWIKINTRLGGSVIVKTKDIDYVEHCNEKDTYELYLKGKDFHYLLRKEAYEQLTEFLVDNKENE